MGEDGAFERDLMMLVTVFANLRWVVVVELYFVLDTLAHEPGEVNGGVDAY